MYKIAMKTRSCKNKGKRLQDLVASKISDLLGIPWGRDEAISSRTMGNAGTDICLIGETLKKFPFSIECKNQETWSVVKWIEQAKENQKKNTDWMVIASKNRYKPVVIMDLAAFLKLYKRLL